MRTNIVIDDALMKKAMRAVGVKTKREAVQRSLELMVRLKAQEQMRELRGKLKWEGDLDAMRRDRFPKKAELIRSARGKFRLERVKPRRRGRTAEE